MGAYTFLSESELQNFTTVGDKDINEALQEVRTIIPEWYIEEKTYSYRNYWFRLKTKTYYTVYQTRDGLGMVRMQASANTKENVLNLLYGLIMGYHSR